jgi:NAD(P)-dependent dehydrogenase (short-subunit alcohol dehydrogenase family)
LAAAGARAEYISCDIRNPAAVQALVADVERRCGDVDALIHGAGILRDQVIKDKSSNAFDDVVSTKVDSLLNLVEAIGTEKLKLAVLFSSVSGFFGNTGQCDYAAANEILNRCARRLQSTTFAKVVALNWGPWSDVGMVTPEVANKMRSNGVQLITPTAGRKAAWQEIAGERCEGVRSILGYGPWIEQKDAPSPLLRTTALGTVAPPLLADQEVKFEPNGSVTARIQISQDRQPFLIDHQIDGKAVFPLAMAVELMAETAAIAQPDWHLVEIADIRMLSGIVLDNHAKEIIAHAEPVRRNATTSEWNVQLLGADKRRRFYQSIVRLSSVQPTPPALPRVPTIAQPALVTASEAYEQYLFHGPAFQVLEELSRVDETGIDAVAIPSDATACMQRSVGPWLIDAMILDAAAQLALVWSNVIHEIVMLPTRATRYQAFGDLGCGAVELRLRTRHGAEQNAYRADIWVTRGDVVLGHIEGLEGAGSAQLNRITAGKSR